MHNFHLRSKKIKVEQLDVEESSIEEMVKDELTNSFHDITPEGGRILLKDAGILIFPKWDITNAMVFEALKMGDQEKCRIE